MPKEIPDELKVIKNSLRQEDPWLILLEVTLPNEAEDVLYLVRNTTDITIGGQEYTAFNFVLEMNKISNAGELPSLKLRVSNIERTLQAYVEDLNGIVGGKCKIIIVSEAEPDLDYAELTEQWDIVQTNVTSEWIDFQLSVPNTLTIPYPLTKFIARICSHKYREVECGYVGALETCSRTLAECELHNNTARFGGFLGLTGDGIRVV